MIESQQVKINTTDNWKINWFKIDESTRELEGKKALELQNFINENNVEFELLEAGSVKYWLIYIKNFTIFIWEKIWVPAYVYKWKIDKKEFEKYTLWEEINWIDCVWIPFWCDMKKSLEELINNNNEAVSFSKEVVRYVEVLLSKKSELACLSIRIKWKKVFTSILWEVKNWNFLELFPSRKYLENIGITKVSNIRNRINLILSLWFEKATDEEELGYLRDFLKERFKRITDEELAQVWLQREKEGITIKCWITTWYHWLSQILKTRIDLELLRRLWLISKDKRINSKELNNLLIQLWLQKEM